MLTLKDFDYQLPPSLIAHQPLRHRDHSRLLFFNRLTQTWSHHHFYDLPQLLQATQKKYVFVRNNSQVIPARLHGYKKTLGKVEVFLIKQIKNQDHYQIWECLTKPGLKNNQVINFPQFQIQAQCLNYQGEYTRQLKFNCSLEKFHQMLNTIGQTPIPPYIKSTLNEETLRQVYQTTYASQPGSVAAPTAGLHFTADLTQKLTNLGYDFIDLTLHVSLGTFLGVKCNNIEKHQMHSEKYEINSLAAEKIQSAIKMQKKIIDIGTTSTRVLETIAHHQKENFQAHAGETSIYLYPPKKFKLTSGLITNFHLPQSTLLMLVAAFTHHPNASPIFQTWSQSSIGAAYQAAISQQYRFFSFGDAMLIL